MQRFSNFINVVIDEVIYYASLLLFSSSLSCILIVYFIHHFLCFKMILLTDQMLRIYLLMLTILFAILNIIKVCIFLFFKLFILAKKQTLFLTSCSTKKTFTERNEIRAAWENLHWMSDSKDFYFIKKINWKNNSN